MELFKVLPHLFVQQAILLLTVGAMICTLEGFMHRLFNHNYVLIDFRKVIKGLMVAVMTASLVAPGICFAGINGDGKSNGDSGGGNQGGGKGGERDGGKGSDGGFGGLGKGGPGGDGGSSKSGKGGDGGKGGSGCTGGGKGGNGGNAG